MLPAVWIRLKASSEPMSAPRWSGVPEMHVSEPCSLEEKLLDVAVSEFEGSMSLHTIAGAEVLL